MAVMTRYPAVFSAVLAAFWLTAAASECRAEFYRYVDQNGTAHYVDEQSLVPPRYRSTTKHYREKYDHLPPQQRALMIRQDHQSSERLREQVREELLREQDRRRQEAEKARQQALGQLETPIDIDRSGSLVLTVTLVFGRFRPKARLVLDTGASRVVIYRSLAEKLGLRHYESDEARVAGGGTIPVGKASIDAIRVGPFELENPRVWIIEHQGPPPAYEGLFLMNFIRRFNPTIDLENRVIRWKTVPPAKSRPAP